MQYIDIFFLLLTLGVGFALYSRLGRRTGHEKPAVPFVNQASRNNVNEQGQMPTLVDIDAADVLVIQQIQKHDKKFTVETFIEKIEQAFEKIVKGFVSGDEEVLSAFMTDGFLKAHVPEIKALKQKKITAKLEFFRLISAHIQRIHKTDKNVTIEVHFLSEQTLVRENDKGKVIDGDVNFIDQINELWTFTRMLQSRGPWMLSDIKPYEAS